MSQLRVGVEKVVQELLLGERATLWTCRALLPHMDALAAFLGRQDTNDFLLPILISLMNNQDWQVKAAVFQHIACLGAYEGAAGLHLVLPCLEQVRFGLEVSSRMLGVAGEGSIKRLLLLE